MSRRLMVEVTEEELKKLDELDKEKTLDELVEDLINYLSNNKPDRVEVVEGEPVTPPGFERVYKHYENANFTVNMIMDRDNLRGVVKLANITITKNKKGGCL